MTGPGARIGAFRYSDTERLNIVTLCRPLADSTARLPDQLADDAAMIKLGAAPTGVASAADLCIHQLEINARITLDHYVRHPPRSPKQERARLRSIARHAASLATLLNVTADEEYLTGSRTSLFWGLPDDLLQVAEGAREKQAAVGPNHVHDFHKRQLCHAVLDRYVAETGCEPSRSRSGRANRLLRAAVDPVMVFARKELGIDYASQLGSADNSAYAIGRWTADRVRQLS